MPELATIATAIEAVKVGPSLSAGSFIGPTHHHVGDTTRSFFVKSRSKILIQAGYKIVHSLSIEPWPRYPLWSILPYADPRLTSLILY